jgi:hypothetical protein
LGEVEVCEDVGFNDGAPEIVALVAVEDVIYGGEVVGACVGGLATCLKLLGAK